MKRSLATSLRATRTGPVLRPDSSRVLMRPFWPTTDEIARHIVGRVANMTDRLTADVLAGVLTDFGARHENVEAYFRARYLQVSDRLGSGMPRLSSRRQAVTGACFTHEYSPESAALFNPSIVPHPDQSGVPAGGLRFILSLRATGEGHISSITFRVGTIDRRGRVALTPPAAFATEPAHVPNADYDKALFARKLEDAGVRNRFCRAVLQQLPPRFSFADLQHALNEERNRSEESPAAAARAERGMLLLAGSNYDVRFQPGQPVSQRVLFPSSPSQSNGIEDARFVRFEETDGAATYFATYTAYDGKIILPQLLETRDFVHFKFSTLNGTAVQNKGMALFPRRIDGRYAMLSRQDDENILIMFSDNLHFWDSPKVLLAPREPWEFLKIGNCGSPVETEAGWVVLSHGVGPMRKYCLGAFLLDLDDPTRVLGRLKEPLLSTNAAEREGYVPNVIYTCGSIVHANQLIIPYAMSDSATSFARVPLPDLLQALG